MDDTTTVKPSFLVLYREYDQPIWRTADQIAKDIEVDHYSQGSGIEWVTWFDTDARGMRVAHIVNNKISTQHDERDGCPVWDHYQIAVTDPHTGHVLATAHYSLNLDA